jgi:hypothetical protein
MQDIIVPAARVSDPPQSSNGSPVHSLFDNLVGAEQGQKEPKLRPTGRKDRSLMKYSSALIQLRGPIEKERDVLTLKNPPSLL